MYIPTAQPSEQAPHRSESQFSASYWALFLTLFMVNGLSVALLMRSLVLCNQVLSELRQVHFTGSQGTRSNQNAVFPRSAITHFTTTVQSSSPRGKQEPENKQTSTRTENEIREGLLNRNQILFCLFFHSTSKLASLKSDAILQCCYQSFMCTWNVQFYIHAFFHLQCFPPNNI